MVGAPYGRKFWLVLRVRYGTVPLPRAGLILEYTPMVENLQSYMSILRGRVRVYYYFGAAETSKYFHR